MENKSIIIDPKKQLNYEYNFYKDVVNKIEQSTIDVNECDKDFEEEYLDEQTLAEREIRNKNVFLFFMGIVVFIGIIFCLFWAL